MKKVLFGLCCLVMMSCGSDYSACDSGLKLDMVSMSSPDLFTPYLLPDLSANVDMSVPDDMRKPRDMTAPSADMSKFCGDGICESNESCSSCETDCGKCPPKCGDGVCESTETCECCAIDCGSCAPKPKCGDKVCNGTETCSSCPGDCGVCPFCGDGKCSNGETCETCACDCGSCCGKH